MFANIIPFLILFPLAIAAILAFVSEDKVRSALVKVSAAIIAAGSLWLGRQLTSTGRLAPLRSR